MAETWSRMPPFAPAAPSAIRRPGTCGPSSCSIGALHRYGDAFAIRLAGYGPFVLVSRPDHVREVFSATGRGPPGPGKSTRCWRRWSGPRRADVRRPAHLRQRKLLLPPFTVSGWPVYRERMTARAEAMVDSWPSACRSRSHLACRS
jgi:cytochrome P450